MTALSDICFNVVTRFDEIIYIPNLIFIMQSCTFNKPYTFHLFSITLQKLFIIKEQLCLCGPPIVGSHLFKWQIHPVIFYFVVGFSLLLVVSNHFWAEMTRNEPCFLSFLLGTNDNGLVSFCLNEKQELTKVISTISGSSV